MDSFQSVTIRFLVPENMGIGTRIMFLCELDAKLCWKLHFWCQKGHFQKIKIEQIFFSKKQKTRFQKTMRGVCVQNFRSIASLVWSGRKSDTYTHNINIPLTEYRNHTHFLVGRVGGGWWGGGWFVGGRWLIYIYIWFHKRWSSQTSDFTNFGFHKLETSQLRTSKLETSQTWDFTNLRLHKLDFTTWPVDYVSSWYWQLMVAADDVGSWWWWQLMMMAAADDGSWWNWQLELHLMITADGYGNWWWWQLIVMAPDDDGGSWWWQLMTMAVDGDIRYKSRPKSARSRVNLFTVGSIAVKKNKKSSKFF